MPPPKMPPPQVALLLGFSLGLCDYIVKGTMKHTPSVVQVDAPRSGARWRGSSRPVAQARTAPSEEQ